MTNETLDTALSLLKQHTADDPIEAWALAKACGYQGNQDDHAQRDYLRRRAREIVAALRKREGMENRIGIGKKGGYFFVLTAAEREAAQAKLRAHGKHELYTARKVRRDERQLTL